MVLAERVIDGVGVWEGFHQVGGNEDDVRALLYTVVVLPAHGLGKVELAGQRGSASTDSISTAAFEFFIGFSFGVVGNPLFSLCSRATAAASGLGGWPIHAFFADEWGGRPKSRFETWIRDNP